MHSKTKRPPRVRFACFEVDLENGQLRKDNQPVRIQGKPFALLCALIQRPGHLISREELYKVLWPDQTFVDFDKNLNIAVRKLREALEDSIDEPTFIETVPKRGYRFLAKVEMEREEVEPAPLPLFTPEFSEKNSRSRWLAIVLFTSVGVGIILLSTWVTYPLHSRTTDRPPALGGSSPHEGSPHGVNAEAYQDYLKARNFDERWIISDVNSALIFINRSIALEPNYAPSLALRSSLYTRLASLSLLDRQEASEKARSDANRAIELDPSLAAGYLSLSRVQRSFDWDWDKAEKSLQKAQQLEPQNIAVIGGLADIYRAQGRLNDAIQAQEETIRLAPLQAESYAALGSKLFAAGRLEEAIAAQQRAVELDPEIEFVHLNRAEVLLAEGLPEDANRELAGEPGEIWRLFGRILVDYELGRISEANAALDTFKHRYPNAFYQIGGAYAYLGQKDRAFDWLNKAADHRDDGLIDLRADPLLKKVRADPRYTALFNRINLKAHR